MTNGITMKLAFNQYESVWERPRVWLSWKSNEWDQGEPGNGSEKM